MTLGICYLTPRIRWDRGAHIPDQAVLVDLASRRFFFFWIETWPHEFYSVAGLLAMAGLGLFLFTSALGRVWCGYTCPQTVWTDLYIPGRALDRERQDARAPAQGLLDRQQVAPAAHQVGRLADHCAPAADVLGAPGRLHDDAIHTFTTFVFGGFMREQVCICMCPRPRIQAAIMDPDAITVAYRERRREPRGKGTRRRAIAEAATRAEGPVGASRSPNVPLPGRPSGVGGPIPEKASATASTATPESTSARPASTSATASRWFCISCALCIDARRSVGEDRKAPRPDRLVALSDETGELPPPLWRHAFRARTILYFVIWGR